jgi:hypothetical protein
MKTNFNFCFKGSRDYVHGTDIVNTLLKSFSGVAEVTDLDLKFSGISSTNLDMIEGDSADNAKVNIQVNFDGQRQSMQLVENGSPVDCRYEYDENKIIVACKFDSTNQQIYLTENTGYTLCENFVTMNKYLLQALFPNEQGKWYFTRLEQKYVVPENALVTVKLIKNFNFRLTKSDILIGDEVIGSVYFTLIRD